MRLLLTLCVLVVAIAIANGAAAKRSGSKSADRKGKGRGGSSSDAGISGSRRGKGKGRGKFRGMTKEERRDFMREWRKGKQKERRERQKDRLNRWRNSEKTKGKRKKDGDDDLPKDFYTVLVDGKPQNFRGITKDDVPDLKFEPEVKKGKRRRAFKKDHFPKLAGESKGPKADGVKAEDFEMVSVKSERKTRRKWRRENLGKYKERLEKRKGKGRRWKNRKGKGKARRGGPEQENDVAREEEGGGKGKGKRRRGKGKGKRRGGKGKGKRGGGKRKGKGKRRNQTRADRVKRAETFTDADLLWPSPYIKYMFGSRLLSSYRRNMQTAMRMWESNSCLRFTEIQTAPSDDEPYIFIDNIDDRQCWADRLGINKRYPYRTTINAGWCKTEIGSLAHELGHVLGLAHSQKRTDRDEHIKVYLDRITRDWQGQYTINNDAPYDDYGIPYYYDSLMHYPATFQGDTVICALDPLTEIVMGQRAKITFKDYAFINKLYCEEECIDDNMMEDTSFEGSTLSQTITGRICQKWSEDSPHSHGYNYVGEHNYCRNPDEWELGPWCYTTDEDQRYEPCISSCQKLEWQEIPSCEGYCHNGGFFDDYCSCKCPDYASGEHCEVLNLKSKYSDLQCGGKIELQDDGSVQSIGSEDYPSQYPANHLCKWWIQAPVGQFVAMEVEDFDLEASNGGDCMYDYVQIDLSNCPASPPKVEDIRFCGGALADDETYYEASKTRDLIITFRSDSSVQHNGFKFNFYAFS